MRRFYPLSSVLPFFVGVAIGCDCIDIPTCQRLNTTAVIFLGRVADGGLTGTGKYRFVVEESFKGIEPNTREIEIFSDLSGSTYGPGERYLVLAGRSENGSLFTNGCMGTIPAEGAEEDIDFLRQWARGHPTMYAQGRIAENDEDEMVSYDLQSEGKPALEGVEIIATKDGKSVKGVSNHKGFFRVAVPEPGDYRVVARFPEHVSTLSEYVFRIEPGSCSEHDIGMWTDSKVSGHIFDPSGQPVPRLPVQIESVEDGKFFPKTVETNGKGEFEFTKVPKGEYVLGVNINGLASKLPYEPRFYPGVAKREDAKLVRVEGASVTKGLDFQIGDRKSTRLIIVEVIWPDGKPVTNVSVMCRSARSDDHRFKHDWISRWTDSRGEAVCEVLSDRDFEVETNRLAWSASTRPVQPVKTRPKIFVGAGSASTRVQIVVDHINDISDKEVPSDMSRFNDEEIPQD